MDAASKSGIYLSSSTWALPQQLSVLDCGAWSNKCVPMPHHQPDEMSLLELGGRRVCHEVAAS